MKILSSFTHPQVVPNLYECLCSAEHKGRYSEECGKQSSSGAPLTSIVFFVPTMEVNGAPKQPGYKLSSKYLPLCSAEQRNSYRFGTTWGWVNDDRIFIFGWTIPLSPLPLSFWPLRPLPQRVSRSRKHSNIVYHFCAINKWGIEITFEWALAVHFHFRDHATL